MPDDTTNEILITRTITISGPHYDTSIDVEEPAEPDGIAVTIRQDNEHAAGNEDLIALTFTEWDALADHVGLVQATYHNPDRGTADYDLDRASKPLTVPRSSVITIKGAGAGTANGPGEPGSIRIAPAETDAQRNVGRPNGQCRNHNSGGEWCWLPAGHPAVRFVGAGGGVRTIAGHVTEDGQLFWAGV